MQLSSVFYRDFHVIATLATMPAAGVTLLVKKTCNISVYDIYAAANYNVISCTIKWKQCKFRLVTIYAASNAHVRCTQFEALSDLLYADYDDVILLGDFNCLENPRRDRASTITGATYDNRGASILSDIIAMHNFNDCWTAINPETPGYTWHGHGSPSRLDRIYATPTLTRQLRGIARVVTTFSDHDMVVATFTPDLLSAPPASTPQFGNWKISSPVLCDPVFRQQAYLLSNTFCASSSPTIYQWDQFKTDIKTHAVHTGIRLAHQRRQNETAIRQKLAALADVPFTPTVATHITELKIALEEAEQYKRRGASVRARCRSVAHGERLPKTVCAIEEARQKKLYISELCVDHETLTSTDRIIAAFTAYYTQLFTTNNNHTIKDAKCFFDNLPRLDDRKSTDLALPITASEVNNAIKRLRDASSPGLDGITATFYKSFREMLVPILLLVYNECMTSRRLPPSARCAKIILIPKTTEATGLRDMGNWRPISLLNVDYKVYASILSARINGILSDIVTEDQVCGVPTRSARDHLLLFRLMADDATYSQRPLYWCKLDLVKAFDRVEHEVLWCIMRSMNLPSNFIEMIKMLYDGTTCCIQVNHYLSQFIPITRSIRQGCPLSTAMFALYLQPLISAINGDEAIHGYVLPNSHQQIKVRAYADDVYIITSDPLSMAAALNTVSRFCKATNAALNPEKTTGMVWGTALIDPQLPQWVRWTTANIRILGIDMSPNSYSPGTTKQMMDTILPRLKRKARAWTHRDLTPYQRAKVWNQCLLALLWYHVLFNPIARPLVQSVERVGALFIHRTTAFEPLPRTTLKAAIDEGGVNLADVTARCASLILKVIFDTYRSSAPWTHIARCFLASVMTCIPHSGHVFPAGSSGFSRVAVQVVKAFSRRDDMSSLLGLVKWKSQHLVFLAERLKTPRVIQAYGSIAAAANRRIYQATVPSYVKVVAWKILHGILPTAHFLYSRNLPPSEHFYDYHCTICNQPEDLLHILDTCECAKFVWSQVTKHYNIPTPTVHYRRFLHFHNNAKFLTSLCMITNAQLWHARNQRRIEGCPQYYTGITARIKREMSFSHSVTTKKLPEVSM